MRPNQNFKRALKYVTLIVGLATLALLVSSVRDADLSGRLLPVAQRRINNEIPTKHFDSSRALEGFTVPKDTHVLFTVPQGTRIARNIFLSPDSDTVPYWGYCFTKEGVEADRKAQGIRGMALYEKTRFFYSLAEVLSQRNKNKRIPADLVDIVDSLHGAPPKETESFYNVFQSGDLCYIMSSADLPAGIDTDNDLVNNALERMLGMNPKNADSDRDGASDGAELFAMETNGMMPDSDLDGLGDACEDPNTDGIDQGETNPNNADSDHDGLCDGFGPTSHYGSGCPEEREVICTRDAVTGERSCDTWYTGPVAGEDVNLNCTVDAGETDPTNTTTFGEWGDYDWKLKNTDWSVGSAKPKMPIPDLPGKDLGNL